MTSRLLPRDATGNGISLSGGQIAGIIIGIVVASLILLAIFIWRLISYRTNRDFFTGRKNNLPPAVLRQRGHIRSTRKRMPFDDTVDDDDEMVENLDDEDEKHLVADKAPMEQQDVDLNDTPQHKAYPMSDVSQEDSNAAAVGPSEQSRTSRWWPYGKASSVRAAPSSSGHITSHAAQSNENVQNEIMQQQATPFDDPAPHHHQIDMDHYVPTRRDANKTASFRQGCTTQ